MSEFAAIGFRVKHFKCIRLVHLCTRGNSRTQTARTFKSRRASIGSSQETEGSSGGGGGGGQFANRT